MLGIPLNIWGAVTWCGILLIKGRTKHRICLQQQCNMISQGPQFRPSIMVEYASYWMKQYACIQALLQLRPALISLLSSSLTLSMAPLRITADQTRMERNYRCSTLAQQHTAQNQSTPTCSACVFRSKKYRFARQRT